jgi:threonine/homoserine/homoserine lactone efflux protein
MDLTHWLAFAGASAVLLAIPGPTVLLVISYAVGHGRRFRNATVAGVALGDFTAMTASMLGLGALLAASAMLFGILKLIGAGYLIYMGVKLWRAKVPETAAEAEAEDGKSQLSVFGHVYAVTALNPKSIVFFVAFLPQFLDLSRPVAGQMAVFEASFLVLAFINASLYALLASAARGAIRKPRVQRAANRVSGSLLIGAGVLTAAWRHKPA